ncbi:MAG: phosphoribosylamine--glycine ligase [Cytophagaceae bacterium]|nr:phosphoribosylamine--glycine ligase [Cytophagaceae bacterium]MDW8456040.1 phosphoribosylamine--glycine ligase [Cytophagaceae bacterium]
MNVLIVGSGGREHAMAAKIKQSPLCSRLYVAPGNAGTKAIAENLDIDVLDFEHIGKVCIEKEITLLVVGPEVPLAAGIRDYFEADSNLQHIKIIGPGKVGAQLESSKDFSKNLMKKYNIPTAASKTFTTDTLQEGIEYVKRHTLPVVLKADGLAAGKGVVIAETHQQAVEVLTDMIAQKKFGEASKKVVVEEYLQGIELSVFILSDGQSYILLPEAKDYKRIGEGDTGPNTGGMGAVSPVPFATPEFLQKVKHKIIEPTLHALRSEGIAYSGFIFFGLMNVNGEPFVIEYNARMGDPETEVVWPRIESDALEMLVACAEKKLNDYTLKISPQTATTVMLVAEGYPGDYKKGYEISGLEQVEDVLVFHAGTKQDGNKIVTNGGRVLALTAFGETIEKAIQKSNAAAQRIHWSGRYYRKDIAFDLIKLTNIP